MTFLAYVKKEYIQAIRENKLLVLIVGFIFFALFTPLMLKLTPLILEKQYGSEVLDLFKSNAITSVSNYLISNLPQICILILCLTIGGIICDEIYKETLIIPINEGANKTLVLFSKFSFYSLALAVITFISIIINVYFSFIIFSEKPPLFQNIINCWLNIYLYILYILSLIFLISTFFKKAMYISLLAAGLNYLFTLLITFDLKINPLNLIKDGAKLDGSLNYFTISASVIMIIIFLIISTIRFNKIDFEGK